VRLTYPLLWSRPGRDACQAQSVNTCAALARLGVEVNLLMPRRSGDPELSAGDLRSWFGVEGDFRLIQRPSRWSGELIPPSTLWSLQAFRDPVLRASDLMLSRTPVMIGMGQLSPIPFATDHYRPWPDDWPWLRRWIRLTARSPRSLGLILHSDYAGRSYARIGIPAEQLLVAHNGADPGHMAPRLDKAEARARLGLDPGRSIALYAGRLNAMKGLDQIFALARLRPGVRFLLVGSEGDGPIEREAASIPNIRVEPWQAAHALAPWLYAADVLLVPAAAAPLERFGNCVLPMKLFSYLAAGRPILAPAAPDTAELLRDGDTATLVPPDRPEAAAEALDRLLGDRGLTETLAAGAARLASGLTWDDRAAKMKAFLERRLIEIKTDRRRAN
jgi:glycosyltransferase involved in cell wall biosynthesis